MTILQETGIVAEGMKRGARLGFPTANIPSPGLTLEGAYAGFVTLRAEKYPAAIYADPERGLLEAHIFDFDEDIYGESVTFDLLEKVAEKMSFTSKEDLKNHIAKSIHLARTYFKK